MEVEVELPLLAHSVSSLFFAVTFESPPLNLCSCADSDIRDLKNFLCSESIAFVVLGGVTSDKKSNNRKILVVAESVREALPDDFIEDEGIFEDELLDIVDLCASSFARLFLTEFFWLRVFIVELRSPLSFRN